MRAAKVQASLRIRAVSPEPLLLAHTSSESRGTFRQKARSLAPLNGWACTVKIYHDRMLKDTNSHDGAQLFFNLIAFSVVRMFIFCCLMYVMEESQAAGGNHCNPVTWQGHELNWAAIFEVCTTKKMRFFSKIMHCIVTVASHKKIFSCGIII